MRRVGNRCNAVGQGSRDHAFNAASGSGETPCCRHIDQPRRKPADTVRSDMTRPLAPARCPLKPSLASPVSGSVELGVNGGRLHAGPLRGCHQVVLVHAVLQTVRDTAFRRKGTHTHTGQTKNSYG